MERSIFLILVDRRFSIRVLETLDETEEWVGRIAERVKGVLGSSVLS